MNKAELKRQRANAGFRIMCAALHLDPRTVDLKRNPQTRQWEITNVPDLAERMAAAQAAVAGVTSRQPGRRGNNSAADIAAAAAGAATQAETDTLQRRVDSLIGYITRVAVVEPLRAGCREHGAIDDDNGQFGDIVNQLLPAWKTSVDFDDDADDNAEPTVSVVATDSAGHPIINRRTNKPITPSEMVAAFLDARPKYRASNVRGGPGAGGHRVGTAMGGPIGAAATGRRNGQNVQTQPAGAEDHTLSQVAGFFGTHPDFIRDALR